MNAYEAILDGLPGDASDVGVRDRFRRWLASGGTVPGLPDDAVLPAGTVEALAHRFSLPQERVDALLAALAQLSDKAALRTVTRFLAFDLCTDRNRYDGETFRNPSPPQMERHAPLYPLLLCLACIPVSRAMCRARGIPEATYLAVAERALGPQMRRFASGSDDIADFPWDLNFYTGSIFLIGRFSYITTPYEDDVDFWRNRTTGKVLGLYDGERLFRRDGQFQPAGAMHGSEAAALADKTGTADDPADVDPLPFLSVRHMTESTVTAHPVNPMGFLEREPVTLPLSEWECVLRRGDWTLGFHIPSGPGYEPEQLLSSTREAFAFFDRHVPERPVRALWSESWLYDPRLSLCMDAERNIVRMQRQMYLYPMERDDAMLRMELFGNERIDLSVFEPRTGLQRAALAYMRAGGRFHTGGMVILREEVDRIGDMPYIRVSDIERFRKTVDTHLDERRPHVCAAWHEAGK